MREAKLTRHAITARVMCSIVQHRASTVNTNGIVSHKMIMCGAGKHDCLGVVADTGAVEKRREQQSEVQWAVDAVQQKPDRLRIGTCRWRWGWRAHCEFVSV